MHTPNAVTVATRYINVVRAARQGEADWSRVHQLLASDFEVRLAGYGGGDLWLNRRDRDGWIERLRSLPTSRLQTETVRVFGDENVATAEQLSISHGAVRTEKPVCFVFDVVGSRVRRLTVYRNDFSRAGY